MKLKYVKWLRNLILVLFAVLLIGSSWMEMGTMRTVCRFAGWLMLPTYVAVTYSMWRCPYCRTLLATKGKEMDHRCPSCGKDLRYLFQ